MYKQKQRIAQNHFEIEELPYFKIESFPLNPSISFPKMMCVRNLTHRYKNLMAKMFAFWLYLPLNSNGDTKVIQNAYPQIITVSEPYIISLDTLTYLYHDLLKENRISKQQWNFVGKIEEFKMKGGKAIEEILMAEYQIKLKQKVQNIVYGVYYSPVTDSYRIKGALKLSEFEVSPSFSKNKYSSHFIDGIQITNSTVKQSITQRYLLERMDFFRRQPYTRQQNMKFDEKYEGFYFQQTKHMDQQILELQVYHNFPALRSKSFVPLYFVDQLDGTPLVGPIFSNSNPHCMFGHFTGYNWNSCMDTSNLSACEICHIQLKEFKRNFLLEYLRDNAFNPCKYTIQYVPEYNRFRIMIKRDEIEEEVKEDIQKLSLDSENYEKESNEEGMQEQVSSRSTMLQLRYTNYLHLLSFLKKTYSKNRPKILPNKEVERIKLMFTLPNNKYFQYELMQPVRGKNCDHVEFADLRLYYASITYKSNGYFCTPAFNCPICNRELNDTDIVYLKEVMPALKLLVKQMFDTSEQEYFLGENPHKNREIDTNSAQIVINNFLKKVFLQFRYTENGQRQYFLQQIQNLYPTLLDPYIHFSQYGLGLKNRAKNFFGMFDQKGQQLEELNKEFQKQWYNMDSEKLLS